MEEPAIRRRLSVKMLCQRHQQPRSRGATKNSNGLRPGCDPEAAIGRCAMTSAPFSVGVAAGALTVSGKTSAVYAVSPGVRVVAEHSLLEFAWLSTTRELADAIVLLPEGCAFRLPPIEFTLGDDARIFARDALRLLGLASVPPQEVPVTLARLRAVAREWEQTATLKAIGISGGSAPRNDEP